MNNYNYTPEKWTKKRYEQCIRELEQYIITLQHQLQAYKDKEDILLSDYDLLKREYIKLKQQKQDLKEWLER